MFRTFSSPSNIESERVQYESERFGESENERPNDDYMNYSVDIIAGRLLFYVTRTCNAVYFCNLINISFQSAQIKI